ncbi:MBL fold metallo-hydrolase [Candidatus Bathyarchaeota archaeon]|nr:MBL fold metallo-hydrolase [Candidatus Bathyarchaeota archaeon]
MEYQRVADSVTLAENTYGSNVACTALEDELVFVDAGLLTSYTRRFRDAMERQYGRKASTLLITHAHIDHIYAMDAFSDCEVIAAEAAKPRFKRFLSTVYDEERLRAMERVFPYIRQAVEEGEMREPTKWVRGELLVGGSLRFNVEGGHSACSSSIYHAADRAMITGDLVQAECYPYFGEPDTDLEAWIDALRRWEKMGIDTAVPGHGPPVKQTYLKAVREYFEEMISTVAALKRSGVPAEEVANHPQLPQGYWPPAAERNPSYGFSITRLYDRL